jgi:lysophospholipase L1-like esterase
MRLRFQRRVVVLLAVGALCATVPTTGLAVAAEEKPGTRPDRQAAAAATRALEAETPGGLQLKINERGHLSRSIAGVASDDPAGGTLAVRKPAGATVRGAYMGIATTGFTGTALTQPVTIDGQPVPMTNETASGIQSFNYFADVTALMKPKLDGAPAGQVQFNVGEPQPDLTDGESVVVIYNDPAVTVDRTVSVLYGALSPTGDQYRVGLAAPINKADPNTLLEMSLGISYSYQTNGTQQFSQVDVNGARLSSSSGGEDDGADHNGALLTVGGDGDSADNPADPNASPTNPRSDDELYDLTPFVKNGDRQIDIQTSNPSLDDNVFMATFTMNPPVTDIATGSGPAYVAVGDSTTTGFSIPACNADRNVSQFGCVGSPPATPYPDRIAAADSSFSELNRVGIWGYTIREAVADANAGSNKDGGWRPQLLAAEEAQRLVTVSLGANDIQFSDVGYWLKQCLAKQFTTILRSTCAEAAASRAEAMRPDAQAMMNRLDKAAANGAKVVITLYYNPYNTIKEVGPFNLASRDCSLLHAVAAIITAKLNTVLAQEARKHNFVLANLGPRFVGHGAGARDSYVFGSDCDAAGAATAVKFRLGWPPVKSGTEAEIQKRFDPHPNAKGTQAQADQILQVVQQVIQTSAVER